MIAFHSSSSSDLRLRDTAKDSNGFVRNCSSNTSIISRVTVPYQFLGDLIANDV